VGLTSIFIALLFAGTQQRPPSAEHIRVIQEAHRREHSRAIRAIPRPRHRLSIERFEPKLTEDKRLELKTAG
jgi:hypothetical protein